MPHAPSSWYALPKYYDLATRDETAGEVAFLTAAFAKYATGPVRSVFEPACGSGRLLVALAARGYRVTGLDRETAMIAYAQRQLRRRKLQGKLMVADMTDFRLPRPVDAAVCLLDSFRHLETEAAARRCLECVAAAVRPGGIFCLGLHLLPPDASLECVERWSAPVGRNSIPSGKNQTRVTVTLRVLSASRKTRLEQIRISLLVRDNGRTLRFRDEFTLRIYTAAQIKSLLASVPEWELLDVFDYWFELDQPLRLTNELSDTVLVLRRR